MEHKIDQVIPDRPMLVIILFLQQDQQLFQEVRTNATGPRSIFPKQLDQMNNAIDYKSCRVANITPDNGVQYLICIFLAETDASTWSVADLESTADRQGREIYGITSNEQHKLKMELYVP